MVAHKKIDLCLMKKTLFLKEVLMKMKALDSYKNPIPFSLKVRQYNRQSRSGGKIKYYENVTYLTPSPLSKREGKDTRNPNHWKNRTRNIKLQSGEIQKIHILFIIEFNGKKVVY